MPVSQTLAGCFSSASREGLKKSTRRPGTLPIAKQMDESWNGGILPEAAVNSARNDHIRMAVNPISVARSFTCPPSRRRKLRQLTLPYLTAVIVTIPYSVGMRT